MKQGKANRVLPRKHTGHSKHSLPTTKKKTLHIDITGWSVPKSDWLYSLQPKIEKLYTVSKSKTRNWLWFRSWTPYCQIQTSVQFSCTVVSDSLRPHESQHPRPPCPSLTPGVHSDSRPLSQWCDPAISSSVIPFSSCPPIPPSIRVFSNESTLRMRCPKYWSFSFSIIPSKEIPGLISFRMDWLGLLAAQGTLKSLRQHHSSKA